MGREKEEVADAYFPALRMRRGRGSGWTAWPWVLWFLTSATLTRAHQRRSHNKHHKQAQEKPPSLWSPLQDLRRPGSLLPRSLKAPMAKLHSSASSCVETGNTLIADHSGSICKLSEPSPSKAGLLCCTQGGGRGRAPFFPRAFLEV